MSVKKEHPIFYKKGNNERKVHAINSRLAETGDKLTEFEKTLVMSEGCILEPYYDSRGYLTIGIGNLMDEKEKDKYRGGITIETAVADLRKEISHQRELVIDLYGEEFFEGLNEMRQEVLTELCYNLGIGSLKTFRNMNRYIKMKNWHRAGCELVFKNPFGSPSSYKCSKYVTQVKGRALDLAAKLMRGA